MLELYNMKLEIYNFMLEINNLNLGDKENEN